MANLDEALRALFEGMDAIYRKGYRSMLVEGMPEVLQVDGAIVVQTMRGFETQRTRIVQEPGLEVRFRKHTEEHVTVGANEPVTTVHIPFRVSDNLASDFATMQERAESAAGLLAAFLDDRVAVEPLFEDVLLVSASDGEPVHVDARLRLRTFLPRLFTDVEAQALAAIPIASESDPAVMTAARWYLRGAQQGPTVDAIVFFWIAVEGLLPEAQGKEVVRNAEMALALGGTDPQALEPRLGRLYGLRADIIHKGEENPTLLERGYYVLERVVRELLRGRLALHSMWPAHVDLNTLPSPLREAVDASLRNPRTWWES